jgi:hypothetical protein
MENSSSAEAYGCYTSQQIPCLSENLWLSCSKYPSPFLLMSQTHPVHTYHLTAISHPPVCYCPPTSLHFRVSNQNFLCSYCFSHAHYMAHLFYSPSYDYVTIPTWWRVQIMKLLRTPSLKILHLVCSANGRLKFTPTENNRVSTLHILSLTFSDNRWDNTTFWTEWCKHCQNLDCCYLSMDVVSSRISTIINLIYLETNIQKIWSGTSQAMPQNIILIHFHKDYLESIHQSLASCGQRRG